MGIPRYLPFEMLFALSVVNQQKTLLSQRSETHGNKVNPQILSTNGKRKKESKHLWSSFWGGVFIYYLMAECLW